MHAMKNCIEIPTIPQLIYDYIEDSGSFGFICVDTEKVQSTTLQLFRMIGIEIPPDYMR
jgi:hypothetical protein